MLPNQQALQQAKEPISVHYEAEKTVSFYQQVYIIDIVYNKKACCWYHYRRYNNHTIAQCNDYNASK